MVSVITIPLDLCFVLGMDAKPCCQGGDVIVVVEANHTYMICRGIEKFGSSTATIAVLGHFSTAPAARASFCRASQTLPFQDRDPNLSINYQFFSTQFLVLAFYASEPQVHDIVKG